MMSRIRRWVSVSLVVILIAVACIAGYGAMQPREHEVSRTITVDRPPAEVFAILQDAAAFPCWRTGVHAVEVAADDPVRFVEHSDDGEMSFVVEQRVPDRRLVVRIADEDLPWGGAWTYELAPTASGTSLTITERGFVDNVFLRGLVTVFMDPSASISRFQTDLLAHRVCP